MRKRNPCPILSDEKIEQVREDYKTMSKSDVSRQHGISVYCLNKHLKGVERDKAILQCERFVTHFENRWSPKRIAKEYNCTVDHVKNVLVRIAEVAEYNKRGELIHKRESTEAWDNLNRMRWR